MVIATRILAVVAATLGFAHAHPGASHERSLAETTASRLFRTNAHRSLAACANHKDMRALQERAAARRLASINEIRGQRRLAAADVIAKDHKSNLTGITPTDFDTVKLFGATPQCVLEPEITQGPYYVDGELIRNDIRENQPGVDLYTQLQFIDINTCQPVPAYYVDFWHCNSTGVYSGVIAAGNGNINDTSLLDATFGRGLYPTDEDGLVQFVTKYPGHYTGRSHHIHILGSHGGTVLPNNTYVANGSSSSGQIFFDQSLSTEVEKTSAYLTNQQPLLTNARDNLFRVETATGFDPVVQYVYLGDSIEDGIFSWISVGVDTKVSKYFSSAATYTANGGVLNPGGGGGGIPPGITFPPIGEPTAAPLTTTPPTEAPTGAPTEAPTGAPTEAPTEVPPTEAPTEAPTAAPSTKCK